MLTSGKDKIEYIFYEHNQEEIKKWIDFVNNKIIDIPEYQTSSHGKNEKSYNVIKKSQVKVNSSIKILFEHNYIANIYLDNQLETSNTVHHIDGNPKNNSIINLIVFETNAEHKRFHNSKYAWLIYNENNHKFNCILKH